MASTSSSFSAAHASTRDIESQTNISSAPPVYAYPIDTAPYPLTSRAPILIHVTEQPREMDGGIPDPHPELLPCAIVGFVLSWIPLIGIINFLVNMNAPRHSTRDMFAQASCCIATVVIIFNLIFWASWN